MNGKIKIGFLFPYSSIVPRMSQDIIDGFFTAIPEQYKGYFQFFPEYTDKGSSELVTTAINKMSMFHNVDIISGIISYKLLHEVIPGIQKHAKLAFFFDLGEYIPPLEKYPPAIFFNSMQMWQLEYALGYWTQKKFSGKGSVLMSVYEAGYQMHSSFWQGAIKAGAREIDMHVLPYDPNVKNIESTLLPYFDKVEKSKVNYLHALFCGNEALDFYKAFKNSSLFGKIPLVVTPHMASENILNTINNSGISIYSATGWNYHSTDNLNKMFIKNYLFNTGKKATEFSVMGYETGLIFNHLFPDLQKGDREKVIDHLKSGTITGPRGKRNFYLNSDIALPVIDIEKISLQNDQPVKIIVEQGEALKYNNDVFMSIHTQSVSGWKNPYLCV